MYENDIESIKDRCRWRAKADTDNKWVYGSLNNDKGVFFILVNDWHRHLSISVKTITLGQDTSYKDKESNEVYEGDILLDENGNMCIVVYRDNTWMLDYMGQMYWYMRDTIIEECVVIGNIYDNPELLK